MEKSFKAGVNTAIKNMKDVSERRHKNHSAPFVFVWVS